ncbi:hypothetical protein PIIN_06046 [Serendipita indica DSM 11827]|uniref:Uncharacterized protein n=1 Tax=Serendipita indica (strain DSM 11827) TaxID=1109443 RepID=G4TLB7_SERID|nr:hypothetical protein PIIN_06046 [Serendipita indica DSM 11827]
MGSLISNDSVDQASTTAEDSSLTASSSASHNHGTSVFPEGNVQVLVYRCALTPTAEDKSVWEGKSR